MFMDSLETAIGLIFVYLLLSLIATSVREAIERAWKDRAKYLQRGIAELFNIDADDIKSAATSSDKFLVEFYNHPAIRALYQGTNPFQPQEKKQGTEEGTVTANTSEANLARLPSYISTDSFVSAILDMTATLKSLQGSDRFDIGKLTVAAAEIPNEQVKTMVLYALNSCNDDLDAARKTLGNWYDSAMDRVTGWYQRHTQVLIFWLGLAACVILNVNSTVIATSLYNDVSLRRVVVAEAAKIDLTKEDIAGCEGTTTASSSSAVKSDSSDSADASSSADLSEDATASADSASAEDTAEKAADTAKCYNDKLVSMNLPMGWTSGTTAVMATLIGAPKSKRMSFQDAWSDKINKPATKFFGLLALVGGWVMTAFAMNLGAPFWFDLLSRFMSVRSSIKPDEKKKP